MRQIVHDWPDDLAISILKNVKGSMKSDSRLLIRTNEILHDKVLPLLTVIFYQMTTFSTDPINVIHQVQLI
jgi:hypothetical protein